MVSSLIVEVLFDEKEAFLVLGKMVNFFIIICRLVGLEFLNFAVDLFFEFDKFHITEEDEFVLFLAV